MGVSRAKRADRIHIRLEEAKKRIIEQAASLQGTSITTFVTQAAYDQAQRVLDESDTRRLSERDTALFLKMLDDDSEPNAALTAAADFYDQVMNGEAGHPIRENLPARKRAR